MQEELITPALQTALIQISQISAKEDNLLTSLINQKGKKRKRGISEESRFCLVFFCAYQMHCADAVR